MKLDKYTVGKRYGKALFELAEEEQVLDSVFHDVQTLREVIVDVPELRLILNNPNVPTVEKQQLLHSLLQEMEEVTRHSLLVITENHRLLELPFIFDAFEEAYYESKRILKATVTTVVPLTSRQKEQLSKKLIQQFGYETVAFHEQIDSSILGGVILEMKHQIIDGSVKTRLETLKKALSK